MTNKISEAGISICDTLPVAVLLSTQPAKGLPAAKSQTPYIDEAIHQQFCSADAVHAVECIETDIAEPQKNHRTTGYSGELDIFIRVGTE